MTYTIKIPFTEASLCTKHVKKLEFYCENCELEICVECTTKGQTHSGHVFERISTWKREKINSLIEPLDKKLMDVQSDLNQRAEKIVEQRNTIERDIHDTFRKFDEVLTDRKTKLICELREMTKRKLKSLEIHREQIKVLNDKVQSEKEKLLVDCDEGRIANSNTDEVARMKEVIENDKILKPDAEADMIFIDSNSTYLLQFCENVGEILSPQESPDPSKCHVASDGSLKNAVVGEKSSILVEVANSKGEPCPIKQTELLQCKLVSDLTSSTVVGSVELIGENKCMISYCPTIKGKHQLHIVYEEDHIRGSPYTVLVKLPVKNLGDQIFRIDGVQDPQGVAINQNGEVIVTESGRHCVSVFNPNGEKLRSFGEQGSGSGQFQTPHGLAVDCDGNIFVTDFENNRIQKFTSDGKFITESPTKNESFPMDIAFNSSNNKVYVVDSKDSIQILNSDLSYFGTFGKKGNRMGQLDNPLGIACDSVGNVYVADSSNRRIQVFTADGKCLRSCFKSKNFSPHGIAIDADDIHIYVSETDECRVSVFSNYSTSQLTSFGGKGGELTNPAGLTVDSSGMLYVCDTKNHCIHVY